MNLTQAADQVLYLQCLRLCKDLKASNDGQVTFPSTVFEAMGMEVLDHLYVGRKPKILRPYITNTEELVNINYKLARLFEMPELEFEQKKLQATKKLADYYHSLYG